MAAVEILNYHPPKTVSEFIRYYVPGELFYAWVVGPVGSGKTTGNFFKLIHMASLQAPGPDGVIRVRAVVVRNTASQLKDTTIKSWSLWFKDGQAGTWRETDKTFFLRFNVGNHAAEVEVLFRPLDTPDDVARVLSLEVTFALVDEFVQLPKAVIEAISARCGRYPSRKDGGATNFGMWGSSNTDTEDCWWYEYFYKSSEVLHYHTRHWESPEERKFRMIAAGLVEPETAAGIGYFLQPSGLDPYAENLENLPPFKKGDHSYYINLMKGKSKNWINQFVEAQWGFSADGQSVISSFEPSRHIAHGQLKYNPLIPIVVGLDPGVTCSAMIFTQMDLWGRLIVLGELVQQGFGARRLIDERLKPYIKLRFPNARIIIAPDPAAANRTQTDERSVVDVFKKHFEVKIESNNRLPLRIDAIDHFTTRSVEAGPALLIDPAHAPALIRALKGGWRWEVRSSDEGLKTQVEDNIHSHPGDGLGYAARYHYKQTDREKRYGPDVARVRRPRRDFGAKSYHMR